MAKGFKTGGRAKGVGNKDLKPIREMILTALGNVGGETYLEEQARKNPTAFLTLVGKVLPLQVTGEGGGPVQVIGRVELVAMSKNTVTDKS